MLDCLSNNRVSKLKMKPTIEGQLILAISVACVILVMGVEW